MLFLLETVILAVICVGSFYASIVDFKERSYPSSVALALFLIGIFSFIFHIAVLNFSYIIIRRGIISIGLAGGLSVLWYKLGMVGDGDGEYLISLALCYPSYPGALASRMAGIMGYIPLVYTSTPFSFLILLNAAFVLSFFIMLFEIVRHKWLAHFYTVYTLSVAIISLISTPKFLLTLPIPALMYTVIHARKMRLNAPFIPCLFGSFLLSLVFGDPLIWLLS